MGERLFFTFALTGRKEWGHGTQGVALGYGLAGLSARAGPQTRLFPHNLHPLNISILNTQPPAAMPHSHQIKNCRRQQQSDSGSFFIDDYETRGLVMVKE